MRRHLVDLIRMARPSPLVLLRFPLVFGSIRHPVLEESFSGKAKHALPKCYQLFLGPLGGIWIIVDGSPSVWQEAMSANDIANLSKELTILECLAL